VNRDEVKKILALYRPGSADAEDPQIAEALALAKSDPELTLWLADHCARQSALRAKFQQIEPPAGLIEQIISERAANRQIVPTRRKIQLVFATALLLLFGGLVWFWPTRPPQENTLKNYQNKMVRVALSPYAMELPTNAPAAIRAFLSQNHAPADFVLSPSLKRAALTGCAVEDWQGARVSMICFHTDRPLPPGAASDLWLFVVDRSSVQFAPDTATPKLAKVNRLITATWVQGNRLYFLGTEGDAAAIKRFL